MRGRLRREKHLCAGGAHEGQAGQPSTLSTEREEREKHPRAFGRSCSTSLQIWLMITLLSFSCSPAGVMRMGTFL